MIRINLLGWREQLREQKKQEFFITLGIAMILVLCLGGIVYLALHIRTQEQLQSNQYLTEQIAILDGKIAQVQKLKAERAVLLAHMSVISQLQAERPLVIHIFGALVAAMPKGIFLTQVEKVGGKITLSGSAESNTRVSELMRNLDASPWLQDPVLTEIKTNDDTGSILERDFQMEVTVTGGAPPLATTAKTDPKEPTHATQ